MRGAWILFFIVAASAVYAQDRLFFTDGRLMSGKLLSVDKDTLRFSDPEGHRQAIPRKEVLLVETGTGRRLLFTKQDSLKDVRGKLAVPRHLLGLSPFGVLAGRGTLVYEHFTKDGRIGFAFPLSVTFDPAAFYGEVGDSVRTYNSPFSRLGWIAGVDVNFYTRRPLNGFFVGPRFRYGTDVFLGRIEGFTLQTQIGYCRFKPGRSHIQHVSIGFGIVRLLEAPGIRLRELQYFPWMSVNYRVGLRW